MRWRYEMAWMCEKGIKVAINAKLETVFTNGPYEHLAKSRRCLVIVDGFYKLKGKAVGGQKREQYSFAFEAGGLSRSVESGRTTRTKSTSPPGSRS